MVKRPWVRVRKVSPRSEYRGMLQPRAQPILARFDSVPMHSDSDTRRLKPLSNIFMVFVDVNEMNSVWSGSCQSFGS